jgi:hypothetical protein
LGYDEDPNEYLRLESGRRVLLSFFEHDGASHCRASIELENETRLELVRRGAKPVLMKWLGTLAEQPLADEKLGATFACRTPESPRAFEALARMKERLLEVAERFRLCEVKLEKGSLALVFAGLSRADIDTVSALMGRLGQSVMGPGGVLVRGEDTLHARCGFCHEDLADCDLATLACEDCSAVVHELCWAEHGHRCPVLGCKGRSTRPVSVG